MAIHDGEFDTSRDVVYSLLSSRCSWWDGQPFELLSNSGTSNALWRIRQVDEPDLVVRLPLTESAARSISVEAKLVPQLRSLPIAVPEIVHVGEPHGVFAHPWMVTRWIEGQDAWTRRDEMVSDEAFALEIADAVAVIRNVEVTGARTRGHGARGGPMSGLIARFDAWLADPIADELVDVAAVRRLMAQAAEVDDEPAARAFQHGDLIPGNVLLDGRRLCAIIDWGSAAIADVAQDLTPAWSMFDERARTAFLDALDVDDATLIRARTIALEQAVGAVLYYEPRHHLLGDVMRRTLDRILAEP